MKQLTLFFTLTVLLCVSCRNKVEIDTSLPPQFLLTFHKKIDYPRGIAGERSIRTRDGKKVVWGEEKPSFHSREVTEIIPIPVKSVEPMYNLRLRLTKTGGRWWDAMIDYNYNDTIIVALDGFYFTEFKANFLTESQYEKEMIDDLTLDPPEFVILKGPFHEEIVKGIMANVKRNSLYYDVVAKEIEKQEKEDEEFDPYEADRQTEIQKRKKQQKEFHGSEDINPFKLY